MIWAGWTILFYSLSGSKLAHYVLPALPPLAILAARLVSKTAHRIGRALGGVGLVQTAAGFGIGLYVVADFPHLYPAYGSAAVTIGTAAAEVLLLTGLAVTLLARLNLVRDAFAVLVVGSVLVLACAAAGRLLATSYDQLGRVAARVLRPGDEVLSFDEAVYGLSLATGKTTTFVRERRHRSPLERKTLWGDRDLAWLRRRWASDRRLLLLIDRDDLEHVKLRPAPAELAEYRDKVLVTNFPVDVRDRGDRTFHPPSLGVAR